VQYTEETSTDTLIVETSPYGSGKFGQAGLLLDLEWSSREDDGEFVLDLPKAGKGKRENRTGISAGVEGSYFPPLLDVEESFGALEGELAGSLGLGAAQRVVVASRLGGRVVWGDFPWHEAAFIGGKESNRGFSSRRFAGDKSAYGSLELRLNILKIRSRLPSRIWVYGLTDAGRVWSDGEDSNEWHPSYGGGVVLELWATPLKVRAEVARNDDEDSLNFYFQTGYAF
jgi:outer membrane translocation and assembly module TamA